MLGARKGARRLDQEVTLTNGTRAVDAYGHTSFGNEVQGQKVHAAVSRMSANKTLLTFQLADVVGLDITIRMPATIPTGMIWQGHNIVLGIPEDVDGRGRYLHVTGYYQEDENG